MILEFTCSESARGCKQGDVASLSFFPATLHRHRATDWQHLESLEAVARFFLPSQVRTYPENIDDDQRVGVAPQKIVHRLRNPVFYNIAEM